MNFSLLDVSWLICLFLVLCLVFYYRRTIYFVVLTAAGRNRHATVFQMLKVPFHLPNKNVRASVIKAQMRVIEDGPGDLRLWSTPIGKIWAPSGATSLPTIVAEQMRCEYGVGKQSVRAGDIVIDGGANVGVFSRTAFTAGAAKVIAFEPNPENIECLQRNFEAEISDGRLHIIPKGLWKSSGTLYFAINHNHQEAGKIIGSSAELPQGHSLLQIEVTSVDEIKKELNLPRVDFIKMDIEGAERHALDGAQQTLIQDKPRLAICMYHLEDDIDVLPQKIQSFNAAYSIECGMCLADKTIWRLRPNILFFR